MAYDEELVTRFRKALGDLDGVREQRMMGGLCFMLNGNMIGGCDQTKEGARRFMFRVGKENAEEALARPGAEQMEMGGRVMRGFVFVDESDCGAKALKDWTKLALRFVATLPPK